MINRMYQIKGQSKISLIYVYLLGWEYPSGGLS